MLLYQILSSKLMQIHNSVNIDVNTCLLLLLIILNFEGFALLWMLIIFVIGLMMGEGRVGLDSAYLCFNFNIYWERVKL